MKFTAAILALMATLASTASAESQLRGATWDATARFEAWREKHGFQHRFTTEGEYEKRLGIYKANIEKIEAHNAQGLGWTMAENEFAHLSAEEFHEQYTGVRFPKPDLTVIPRESFGHPKARKEENPDSVDWTTKGAVTPVKNQGSCGSCWSFSTTGSMEGSYFLKNGNLVSFSEQNLVSCDTSDNGCGGGLMDNAFKWIEGNGGLCSEADYPYTSGAGASGTCDTSCTPVTGSTITSFTDVSPVPQVTPATEAQMEAAVAQQPVSVAIQANQSAFQFYSGGVMTGSCGTQLDHGVLVVGYGTDSGTDYWKIKNSWGPSWGMDGYINIEKGLSSQKGGQCGVLLAASYPNF